MSLAPDGVGDPSIAVLTPGIFNSAYFEHSFLAQRMGATLVEGGDLVVMDDDRVYMRTIDGLEPVDVVYRRIDDLFLDPEAFRPDSTLGVPGPDAGVEGRQGRHRQRAGRRRRRRQGRLRLGARHHPLLPRRGAADPERADVPLPVRATSGASSLDNLRDLVLKPANESGGYGILIGNRATDAQLEQQVAAIEADPRNWVAQPILQLSTAPTLCGDAVEPRHVDLRPFILSGATSYVTAGGLTRVALAKGSLVVNSSQGGGSKDTWIVDLGADWGMLD